ncbi:MAG: zinc ribbon domain-containing protein [Desulfofustis sp.]|jgi:putative FmdB family regulatory protein|nr:zinc ribbon domain-containing protein [Desulfofustis sp.]
MPVYDYRCEKCDRDFSLEMKISDYTKKKISCPKCKSKKVKRQISSFQTITSKKS